MRLRLRCPAQKCYDVMKSANHKKNVNSYELKKGSCPVNGLNTYSVFKNGALVFMMDGDRASVFKPDDVEVIITDENSQLRLYRVADWVFTGSVVLTENDKGLLPKCCIICPAAGKSVEL